MPLAIKPHALIVRLTALSLWFSTIEHLVPRPLPFVKLGLANVALLLGLPLLSWPSYLWLLLLKVISQTLLHGTLASYVALFSLVSTFSSGLIMKFFYSFFKNNLSIWGLGALGALASSFSQLLLSIFIIFGPIALVMAPIFLLSALISSLLVSTLTYSLMRSSLWWKRLQESYGS